VATFYGAFAFKCYISQSQNLNQTVGKE